MAITHHEVFGCNLSLLWTLLKTICSGTDFTLEIELEVKPKLRPKRVPLLKNKKISRGKRSAYFHEHVWDEKFHSYRFKHAVRP